ncbi:hypothetical protein HYN46_07985 [Aquirhabdus parva]|uniref:Uncharacterized protein n=2 Tax=Aquirhabdus parva TaxID=2283318 RepID=A0A345PBF5_9GAMM|nr:hypothetical protein HYN46_07985 [Aquirhabdus parva]
MRWLKVLIGCLAIYAAYDHYRFRAIKHPEGSIVAPNDPVQLDTNEPMALFKGYVIQPLKDFSIEARVLSTERYRFDTGADIVPIDIALGWGRMSDSAVIEQLNISQSGRFYRYSYKNAPPIPIGDIISHSANMHMIPANDLIAKQLENVRVGQILHLSGQLVEITDQHKRWKWKSSLTREDSGAGACELIWVKQVFVSDD